MRPATRPGAFEATCRKKEITSDAVSPGGRQHRRSTAGGIRRALREFGHLSTTQLQELDRRIEEFTTFEFPELPVSARNRLLGGARPIDLLAAGNFEAVLAAANAFVDGAYV